MPRVLCVWFPMWPIQRLRIARPELRRSEPVLFASQSQRPLIVACSAKVQRLGLRIGQPLAEAKALLPRAVYLAADHAADRAALCQLAIEFQCFTPLVGLEEMPEPECLLCEVAGCTHLWNGEEKFLEAVRSYWRGRGYHVQLALAGTLGAAWALAHTMPHSLVPSGHEAEALSSRPVSALRLPAITLERLETLGLYLIGDVFKLPRDTLASRFGVILPRRIDEALGLLSDTFLCERLKEPLTAFREWEVPIDDRFAVNHLCRLLLRELLSMSGRAGMGLLEIEGEIETEADSVKVEIRLVEPTRDEPHLAQLAELQLERRTWSGGVTAVRWSALRLGLLEQAQGRFFVDDLESKTSRVFNTLVERLGSRLEAKAVLRAEFVADAQPEHAVRLVPWTSAQPPQTDLISLCPVK
ncbi:MAG TPA: DNA polymerase Y family protein, partial [Pirellulales bacterium]|nr:DNA polymerase Y family protein [Pirellulales bacterium]